MNQRSFGQVLKERRMERNLSQRALAEKLTALGVSIDQAAIARTEAGRREPKLSEALQIAEYLGFEISSVHIDGLEDLSVHGGFEDVQASYYRARLALQEYLGAVTFTISTYRPRPDDEPGWRDSTELAETLLDNVKRLPGREAENFATAPDWSRFDFMPWNMLEPFLGALTIGIKEAIDDGSEA